ncbi:MAG: hypothetical protein BGO09_16105 [Bacteroidetes bacterium 47-18]|nr:MAG: hypothetical protein BGO09_16105 [Bacteroidetes bacterium 47-18]
MTIFVGNLNFRTTEKQLHDLFAAYGTIQSVKIITDVFSGHSRGFAFIRMTSSDEAREALRRLDSCYLDNNQLILREARPRTQADLFKKPRL